MARGRCSGPFCCAGVGLCRVLRNRVCGSTIGPVRHVKERPLALPTGEQAARAGTWWADRPWIASVAALVAIWLFVLLAFRGQPGDDPYITYHYASNLVHGKGFVFNVGERVQSTTTPLYTLLLAGGGLLGFDIPTLGYYLSMLFLLLFAVCCIGLLSTVEGVPPWVGPATAALTFACPVTTYGLGTEMPLLMSLAWGSWWAGAARMWVVASGLAGLAAITRGDGALVGVALLVYFLAIHGREDPRRWPWGAAALYLGVAAPWYLFAWLYFGSPLPATLGAKLAQGSAPGASTFVEGLGIFWQRSFGGVAALWLPALALLMAGVAASFLRGRRLALPWVWAALFIVGFGLLNVPRYPWYYAPLVPVAMLGVVLGGSLVSAEVARRVVRRGDPAAIGRVGGLVVGALVAAAFLAVDVRSQRPEPAPRSQLYRVVGEWLAGNTPAEASVGAEEVGFLGYYSGRRIIDFVGLIQPDVAPRRARGDNLWAVQTYQPDYIVALPAWQAAVGADPWVSERYEALRTFEWPGSDSVTVLRKR